MAKKSKHVDSDSGRDPRLDRVVIVTSMRMSGERFPRVYVFTKMSAVNLSKNTLAGAATFEGFDAFEQSCRTRKDIDEWAKLFETDLEKCPTRVEACLRVWDEWLGQARAPELEAEKHAAQKKQDTAHTREGKLSGRKYVLVKLTDLGQLRTREQAEAALPPQAKKCLEIMRELCGESGEVTEERMRNTIIERADELHTRQDPWRIFQYYRARMIEEHHFVLV